MLVLLAGSAWAEHLETPYMVMDGSDGEFTSLQLDGSGKGHYGQNYVQSLRLDGMEPSAPTSQGTNWVEYAGITPTAVLESKELVPKVPNPIHIEPGRSYGQSFVADKYFTYVGGCFPTWCTGDAGFTMSLYEDGPKGAFLGHQVFRNIPDNGWIGMTMSPKSPGKYYLQISDPVGTPGWYTDPKDSYAGGQAFVDGLPLVDADRSLQINAVELIKGTWRVTAEGNKIKSTFTAENGADTKGLKLCVDVPWGLAGYDVTDPSIPFRRFYSDLGQYYPIEQFKREYTIGMIGKWIHATGRNGADLRFTPGTGSIGWNMTQETMSLSMNVNSEIEILPQESPLPAYYPVFFSSDPKLDRAANPCYYERACSYATANHAACWMPWMALEYGWTGLPLVDKFREHLETYPMRADGYVHSWGNLEGWPFPGGLDNLDHRQFYTNSCYILACADYYFWSGDKEFLSKVKDRLRKACDYMLNSPDTNGKEGLLRLTSKDHDGTGKGLAGTYWDNVPFGYLTAYENVYFYGSLKAMADLGRIWGDTKRANELTALRDKCRKRYNELFWNDKAGRYIGCIDVKGVKHDKGFAQVNLEAAAYGLPSQTQAQRIYHWLEKEPTATGKADTYSAFIFAPRSNTIDTRDWWFMNSTVAPYNEPFGDHNQNGGAIMYVSYFDLMARRNYLGADNAMKRFREILDRYEKPDKLCGGTPLYYGESDATQVGTSIPFPESGLVPTYFLHGLVGVNAKPQGLVIDPRLPKGMTFAGVKHVWYHGKPLTIKAFRDHVEVTREDTRKTTKLPIKPGIPAVYRLD